MSGNPSILWTSVSATLRQIIVTHDACSWAATDATLDIPGVTAFRLQGLNRPAGRSTEFHVEVLSGGSASLLVHFTCDAERRLHAVQFDSVLRDSAMEPSTKNTRLLLRVTWT